MAREAVHSVTHAQSVYGFCADVLRQNDDSDQNPIERGIILEIKTEYKTNVDDKRRSSGAWTAMEADGAALSRTL